MGGTRPSLRPEGEERRRVLLLHGEIEGVFPFDRSGAEYGGALLGLQELAPSEWSYVALGHYHVQHRVAPRVWYAGSLEYVSPNLWGELVDEANHGSQGKGWLLVDVDRGTAERRTMPLAREILDLEPIEADGLQAAAVNALIAERVAGVPGGVADKVVRVLVRDIPRHVGRELDHGAVRALKASALHFHLDLRRPEVHRMVGTGAPGRRQTLPELVRSYLERRPLPAELDREAFVKLGESLMDSVERDLTG
jgi:DNA repair exonuclease SbcCD nuclease subunit